MKNKNETAVEEKKEKRVFDVQQCPVACAFTSNRAESEGCAGVKEIVLHQIKHLDGGREMLIPDLTLFYAHFVLSKAFKAVKPF